MKEKMRNKDTKLLAIGFGVILVAFIFLSYGYTIVVNDRFILTNYLIAELTLEEVYAKASEAERYYSLSSESYDYNRFEEVVEYCELSREYASDYVQEVREIKAEITPDNYLMRTYQKVLDEHINIYNNLYEACEYFESAARCYENDDYDCGGVNIDGHNEKIRMHDSSVNRNNEYVAQINKVLKEVKAGEFDGIR